MLRHPVSPKGVSQRFKGQKQPPKEDLSKKQPSSCYMAINFIDLPIVSKITRQADINNYNYSESGSNFNFDSILRSDSNSDCDCDCDSTLVFLNSVIFIFFILYLHSSK